MVQNLQVPTPRLRVLLQTPLLFSLSDTFWQQRNLLQSPIFTVIRPNTRNTN